MWSPLQAFESHKKLLEFFGLPRQAIVGHAETSLKDGNATLWTSALVPALSKPTEDKVAKIGLRTQCRQAKGVMDKTGCTLHPLLLERMQLAEKLKL